MDVKPAPPLETTAPKPIVDVAPPPASAPAAPTPTAKPETPTISANNKEQKPPSTQSSATPIVIGLVVFIILAGLAYYAYTKAN